MFKPRDVGDFSYSIHLENSFDAQNSTCIPIHCIVSVPPELKTRELFTCAATCSHQEFFLQVNAEYRKEGLLVTGVGEDGVLDFGDCYADNGSCQMMTLRNITQEVRRNIAEDLLFADLKFDAVEL